MIEYNPLDVLRKRLVKVMPVHFSKMKVSDVSFQTQEFETWIETKLSGRYSISSMPSIASDGKLKCQMFVGFEDPKELTYFMLACPYIRRK